MNTYIKTKLYSIYLSLVLCFLSFPLHANPLKIELFVVEAQKNNGQKVDGQLEAFKDALLSKFSDYQSFKAIDSQTGNLSPKQEFKLKLSSQIEAIFQYEGQEKSKNQIRLQTPKRKVDLKLLASSNHTIFQVMQKNKKQDTLLILVMKILE